MSGHVGKQATASRDQRLWGDRGTQAIGGVRNEEREERIALLRKAISQ